MLVKRSKIAFSLTLLLSVCYTFGTSHWLVLICRVGRVTECGGEVGRLNVVGGAEVCSLPFVVTQKFPI
jgi:hypothetical protein